LGIDNLTKGIHVLSLASSPPQADFFRYVVATPGAEHWGAVVTGGGRFTARPHHPYPPRGHPPDHRFTWENGRVLGAFQVVYVAEGRGEFEARSTGRVPVGSGTALLLFPGTWHRYRPAEDTGWLEQWVEIGGPLLERMLRAGIFSPERPVIAVSRVLELEARIESLHGLVSRQPTGDAPELAAQALSLLSLLHASEQGRDRPRSVVSAVEQAKRIMEEASGRPVSMPALARSLGVAYSYFRREFRLRTGISPRQYLLRIRMQRAQRMLGSSGDSLKQVADRLGFSSAYHLSSAFKAAFGVAPSHWRRRKLER
jgi:AraC-like DNA-binding protein